MPKHVHPAQHKFIMGMGHYFMMMHQTAKVM